MRHSARLMHDARGAGSNIATGWRLVRPGGRVKFDGFWHQSDELLELVGQYVHCRPEDAFYNEIIHVTAGPRFACQAWNGYERDHIRQMRDKAADD
jgi:hypothetical protein